MRVLLVLGIISLMAVISQSVLGEAATIQQQEETMPEVRCDPFLNGLASLVIPGWGQWLNGEGRKAVTHVVVWLGLGTVAFLLAPTPASLILGLGASIWNIYSAYDAFRTCVALHEALKMLMSR